jgi:hypothetical protein
MTSPFSYPQGHYMQDLNTIIPTTIEVQVGDEVITVKPFTFGQLPKVMSLSKTIYGHISSLFTESTPDQAAIIIEAMSFGGEDFIGLMSLSTGKPRGWFDTLEMDDGVKVAAAFLEANLGFFVRKVLPELKTSMESLQKMVSQ